MPPGGFLTTYANPLPPPYHPEQEQTWFVPCNDAYTSLNYSYTAGGPPNILFQGSVSAGSTQLTLSPNSLLALNELYVDQPINVLDEPVYLIEPSSRISIMSMGCSR